MAMYQLCSIQLQKELKCIPKTVGKVYPQESHCEKRCEIQGGGQEWLWW